MSDNISFTTTKFLLYTTDNKKVKVDVLIQNETVWLTQKQMSELFDKERSVITKHINNVFKEGELEQESNVQFLHIGHSVKDYNIKNIFESAQNKMHIVIADQTAAEIELLE